MSKVKALTLNEIKNMDGKLVFTVPVIDDKETGGLSPSFSFLWRGLGFRVVNVEEGKLIDEKGFWLFNDINPTDDCGFIAFKEKVTEKEAIKAWEEMKLSGMVR